MDDAAIARIFRDEFGRSVAGLVRSFGDIELAEDAVQEAFALALDRWPRDGLPPKPGAWITTTARNRAVDRLRREARGRQLQRAATPLGGADGDDRDGGGGSEAAEVVGDDRLRLVFTCCHPALSAEARIALTLRLVGGLSTAEVARAFLVPEATMAKRLVRVKHKIRAARISYRVPTSGELAGRLPPVLTVVYLVYDAGAAAPDGASLRAEAIRLARLVAGLMPDEPEVTGLLALLLFTESRQSARFADDGSIVVLAEQDRRRWDRTLIGEGRALVRDCLRRNRPGPYQLQAAINAVHVEAPSTRATDWPQIVALYDHLLELSPTSVVVLNRAIAVSEARGPGPALALIEGLGPDLDGYHLLHATRAHLLHRLGRGDDAAAAYRRAAALAPTESERAHLRRTEHRALRPAALDTGVAESSDH